MGILEDKLEHYAATVALEGQRTREAFEAGLSEFVRGQRVTGAIRRPIRDGQVYTVGGRLVGWSVRAAGGTVTIDLYDGHDDSGDLLAAITLADGESNSATMMPSGITVADGIYANVTITDTVQGTPGVLLGAIWIGAVD